MKNLMNLLLVLSLIGFTACGSKKNKTDEAAVCVPAVANNYCQGANPYGYNPYTGGSGSVQNFVNKEQMVAALNAGNAFATTTNSQTLLVQEWEMDENGFLGFIDQYDFVGSEYVVTNANGTIQGSHPYGSSYADIVSKLVSDVGNAAGFQSYGNGIYKITRLDNTVLMLNTYRSIGANPFEIYQTNDTVFVIK